jgi:hypothetical protein
LMLVRWLTLESTETLGFLKAARSSAAFASIFDAEKEKSQLASGADHRSVASVGAADDVWLDSNVDR